MFVVLNIIVIYAKVYMGKTKTTTVLYTKKIGFFIILALNFHNKKKRVCVCMQTMCKSLSLSISHSQFLLKKIKVNKKSSVNNKFGYKGKSNEINIYETKKYMYIL